ncbi:hypothetical protein ACIBAG_14065 [Streptomyces sp. NPDC051243]|uniref:hypothetical protein n=1 Tax=Streptomyces sp. NPDC051243 TaxID=3365646 RepID=UPI00378E4F70
MTLAGCGGGGGDGQGAAGDSGGGSSGGSSWDPWEGDGTGSPGDGGGKDPGGPTWDPRDDEGPGGSGHGGGDGGKDKDTGFAWLPPGPDSPNTNIRIDPEDIYDRLHRFECTGALADIEANGETDKPWNLVRGLTFACLAAKGETARWKDAVQQYDSLDGPGFARGSCRDTAAYRMLKQVVDWHRQHPQGKVTLLPASEATTACPLGITNVDPGPEVVLEPPYWGFTVEGTWPSEVINVDLEIEGATVLTLAPHSNQCCEGAKVSFQLPESFEGTGLVDLTLHFQTGGSMTRQGAISIDGGSVAPSPDPDSPSPNSPSPESPSSSFSSLP